MRVLDPRDRLFDEFARLDLALAHQLSEAQAVIAREVGKAAHSSPLRKSRPLAKPPAAAIVGRYSALQQAQIARAMARGAAIWSNEADLYARRLPCAAKPAIVPRAKRASTLGQNNVWMNRDIRIALDVMGGDHGPSVVVKAAAIALERRPDVEFIIFGDRSGQRRCWRVLAALARKSHIRHCDVAIKMTDKPSQALRAGRRTSSMWLAIEAVKKGEADCAVSAGNTGALMAMAKVCLHTMSLIERPAIAAMWPTVRGESIVLDVGATIGADAEHLIDLAIMGAAMARIVFDIESPTVGLLNVGVEEIKGIEEVKTAGRVLRETALPTCAITALSRATISARATVDVVVTEGFTGNIALKTAEGTAKQIGQYIRDAMGHSWLSRLGYLLARGAFKRAARENGSRPGRRRRFPRP